MPSARWNVNYSADRMPIVDRQSELARRVSRYLERIFDPLADRVADKVVDRLSETLAEVEAHVATLEVLLDDEAMDDLRAADAASDEDARPYEEIRRELGLA